MDFAQYVTQHYAGQLASGVHNPIDGAACALEAYHAWRGEPWSDTPNTIWDFRPLNDGGWSSDAVRGQHLAPVIAAYADCRTWPLARQQAIAGQIVLLTVQQIVAALPGLPAHVRQACQAATTLKTAAEAAAAAAKAVPWDGESPARAAAEAAAGAAKAVPWDAEAAAWAAKAGAWAAARAACAAWVAEVADRDAAGDRPLITMCAIFLAALEEPV